MQVLHLLPPPTLPPRDCSVNKAQKITDTWGLAKNVLFFEGFITEEGFVKCSLMEFNAYRKWLRKLKLDAVQQKRRLNKIEEEKLRQERAAQLQLEKDKELYSIIRAREEKAKEAREKSRKRKEKEQAKYLKKMEEDARRRYRFKEDQRRRKEYHEIKRNHTLEKRKLLKADEEKKVSMTTICLCWTSTFITFR